jgi:hypothetical protein
MSAPGAAARRSAAVRLAGIGLLAAGVTVALYVAGRLNAPDYAFGLFGQVGLGAIAPKSMLASITLGLAVPQVLLALWIYRKLPLAASPPRPARLTHKSIGFGLFALTVPVAVHCLLAYGVQLTSLRVAVHSLAGFSSTVPLPRRCCWYGPGGCLAGRCQLPGARSPSSSPCSGTPPRSGITTVSSCPRYRRTDIHVGPAREPSAWTVRTRDGIGCPTEAVRPRSRAERHTRIAVLHKAALLVPGQRADRAFGLRAR